MAGVTSPGHKGDIRVYEKKLCDHYVDLNAIKKFLKIFLELK